jgi:hypothetical protein
VRLSRSKARKRIAPLPDFAASIAARAAHRERAIAITW